MTGATIGSGALVSQVPEPQSPALFGLAVAALSLARRRRLARK